MSVQPLPPGFTRRPAAPALSPHEAAVVARFDAAQPAPESWQSIADAIEADDAPGLTGEALDAWNAATIRAANIARAALRGPS